MILYKLLKTSFSGCKIIKKIINYQIFSHILCCKT
nr:MAG TPA: hypothetical protein [Caudoviricetes sp.]